jgi:RimJ/RimL family protein N-acetyltransferase
MPRTNDFGQQVGDPVPGWTTRATPQPITLEGRYVTLEPLSTGHAESLYDALANPGDQELWTYRPTDPPTDVPGMVQLIESTLAAPGLLTFALVPRGERAQGIASYTRIDPATGQVEIAGVLYAKTLQRTRAATEAIHLSMRHAFEDLGYRRFEWKCDSLNEPSRRAAARLGFTYEGRFRNHMVTKGFNRDTDWFSVTDAEWPAVRAEHERWLDPANFDDAGGQLTRLRVPRPAP